ncbi:restriction endonuclease [Streptomyces sp. NPDC050703]|uniref:restriction endonuclease n=1 Tax=Streptomyces sp. NPDC050703 TaxID=3157218 RepID=UPI003433B7D8
MDITVGAEIRRRELHDRYGGSRQSGISHSRSAPVVMCFTDPAQGARYGYRDGWDADGLFHYTGEGQVGDQRMTKGNKAILNHVADQRELHVFEGVRSGVVRYRGQYDLPDPQAWYRAEALDREGDTRSVIIFKLKPRAFAPTGDEPTITYAPATATTVSDIPPENFLTTRTLHTPNGEPTFAYRRESELLTKFSRHLTDRGHEVSRKKIRPRGERRSLYTDLFDSTDNLLVEAKGQATRESIRMAIGQLFDYQRYIDPCPQLAILVPSCPRKDLRDLCASLSIHTIWPVEGRNDYQCEPPL